MQISTLIGKPVLSPGGRAYGYVTGVRLTQGCKKISCLVCADGEEEEFYLPVRAIKAANDAVIAGKARLDEPSGTPSPIGKPVFSHTGESLGTVSDILLEGEEARLVISNGGETAAPAELCSIAETVILYPDSAKKNAAAKQSERPARRAKSSPKEPATQEISLPAENATPAEAPPSEQAMDRTDLLGRHVRRSVFDAKGGLIAATGEEITPAVLQSARRAGKLLELAANTLTTHER